MKINIFLAVLLLAAVYATCRNFRKTDTTPTAATPDAAAPAEYGTYKVHGERPDSAQGLLQSTLAPPRVEVPWQQVAKPSASRRAFMASGYWNPITALVPSDTTVHVHYKPKWLKFREDQTFDIIKDGKVLETGHWAFDETQFVLYLACQDTYFNNTWKVLEKGFRLVLIGNTDLNRTGIQARLDNYPELPK
jgi:hypothetical protein